LVLIILDGWGLSPSQEGNATLTVATPNFDQLMSFFPHTSLHASGEEVGLSWGEMGNSEVGHLNLGTGRIIMQDLPRIDKSIKDGSFFANQELLKAFQWTRQKQSNLHLIGLASAGGVHSHLGHLFALLDLAAREKVNQVFIHMITDGRDTPAKVALNDLESILEKCRQTGVGKIATLMGRYFAMDRDKRWDRVQKAYAAMFEQGVQKASAEEAINSAYAAGKTDEFIEPIAMSDCPRIKDGDSIIFFNYRSDRAREFSQAIINHDFKNFPRQNVLKDFYFVSFTSYGHEPSPNVKVAFFAEKVKSSLAQLISENKFSQLHLAETEKYPHVTYFFNAGQEKEFPGEKRILVPSPKVATYDLKPEMSAQEVANKFLASFEAEKPIFTVLNFANPDMVGHTGILTVTEQAIATVDACLGQISHNVLSAGANLIITADHGNAEEMINLQTKEPNKEHTTNPVPLILALPEKRLPKPLTVDLNYKINLAATPPVGVLADITTTCLDVLGIAKPPGMAGQSLRKAI